MTSRDRLLTALSKGRPDRLPVSVHQWQDYHLRKHLGGVDALAAFARFGMDVQVQYLEESGRPWDPPAAFARFSTPEWRDEVEVASGDPDDRAVRHVVRTPGGVLTYATAGNRATTWITEFPLKRDEDLDLVRRYMPVRPLDIAAVDAAFERVGDRGILRGFVWGDQAGCWQHACCLMDVDDLILKAHDDPGWVHALLEALLEKKLRFIESMRGARFDLVETGGGAGSSTVISPKYHAEFCEPYDRRMHDALHALGFRVTYHTCGGTLGIEESIVRNGCDASETLAPRSVGGNQEPWELKRKVAGRLALIGGIDQHNVVTAGTRDLVRRKVFEAFEKVGADGGYVCSLSDHFFETPAENLGWFAEAARECVY